MRAHLVLGLAVALLAAPGCQAPGSQVPASRELSAAQFDDVPVPAGFTLDLAEGRSYSYAEGGSGPSAIRMGRLEYTGQGVPAEVLAWYAVEMARPIHGWSSGSPTGRDSSMMFRRGVEACLVTARPEGAALRIVVERNTGRAVGRE